MPPPSTSGSDLLALADRVERLAARLDSIDIEVRASSVAVDEKSLRELRRTVEALSKRDPKFEDRMTNKVDVLADRLQTLAKTVSTTGSAKAALDGDIAALRKELDGMDRRIDAAIAELRKSVDPKSIEELRKAIATVAEQKLPRKLDSRIDGLTGKVEVTSQRVDTLATTVATTAAGLAGREGEVAALRKKFEEETARVEMVVSELRKSIDPRSVPELREVIRALSERTIALERESQREFVDMSGKVDVLSNRFDTLADWASTTGTYLTGRDEEIAASRTSLQETDAKLESAVGDLRDAVGVLTSQVATLDDVASGEVTRALEGSLETVSASVADLVQRLESLEAAAAAAAEGDAAQEAGLTDLGRGLEEARAQIDAHVADLRQSLETVAGAAPDPVLVERLDGLTQQVEALAAQVETAAAVEPVAAGPDPLVVERLDTLAQQVEELAGQVEAAAALEATPAGPDPELVERVDTLTQLLGELAGQVEAAAALEPTSAEPDPALVERLEGLAQQVEALAERVEAGASGEGTPPGPDPALVERLEALAQQVEELGTLADTLPAVEIDEELFAGLARRVESLERDIEETVDNAITRVRAAWELDRDSLVGEMDTVAGTLREQLASLESRESDSLVEDLIHRIDSVERDREAVAAEIAGGTAEEIGDVRTAIDALVARIASNEEDLAAVAEAPLIVARLDDLARRLETLEREKSVPPVAPEPVLGDGRFRVEVRALELRIDHAEETARENREAVLVQLERLASRIDMRLDRLENARNPGFEQSELTAGGAQVVPIRSTDV